MSAAGVPLIRSAGVAVLAAKLALVPIAIDLTGEDVFGVAKSVASRGLMYILVAVASVYVLTSPEVRVRLRAVMIPLGGLGAFALIALLATVLAPDPRTATFGAHHRYLGLTSIVDGVTLAAAIPLFVTYRRDLLMLLAGLFAGAGVVLLYAGVQAMGLDPIQWADPSISSTLGNRGVFAGYCVVIGATALATVILIRASDRQALAAVVAGIGVLACGAVALSGARGPFLALVPALAFAAGVAARQRGWGSSVFARRSIALAAGGTLLAIGFGAATSSSRVLAMFVGGDTSVTERSVVYAAALEAIGRYPILGAGPDGFGVVYAATAAARSVTAPGLLAMGQNSAHSWPLHHAVGTGLLGSAILLALIANAYRLALRRPGLLCEAATIGSAALTAFLLQGVFNVTSVGTEFLFWTSLGLCATTLLPRDHDAARSRSRTRLWLGIALGFGVATASTGMNWVRANEAVRTSDLARAGGRFDVAERAAELATQLDPGRANNWNVLGLARSLKDPAGATRAFQRASDLAPHESRYLINVAKEEARLGEKDPRHSDRMLNAAKRATVVDPRSAETHMVLSFALLRTGDAEGARAVAERAVALAPADPSYLSWSAAIHEETGDIATAIQRYRAYAKAASIENTREARARLGRLYLRAGDRESARLLVEPKLIRVEQTCDPNCRVLDIRFDSPLGLATTGAHSAADPARYTIDGRPLPEGTSITVVEDQVVLRSPGWIAFSRQGAELVVRAVADVEGFRVSPDPTTTRLR